MDSIAINLFTVRKALEEDYEGTIRKIRRMGYSAFETGLPVTREKISRMLSLLDETGMKMFNGYVSMDQLDKESDKIIACALEIGVEYLAIGVTRFDSAKEYEAAAAVMQKAGAKLRKAGIGLMYHNHGWEFKLYDGTAGLDILLANTDEENLKLELDSYWCTKAGIGVTAYIKKHGERIAAIHIKDMSPQDEKITEIGTGILDFKTIVREGTGLGVKWFSVEQDYGSQSELECARIAYEYLKQL